MILLSFTAKHPVQRLLTRILIKKKANFCQRSLLTVDEVVTPQVGNCTIFARYAEPTFATQVILTARLTRLY